MYVLTTRVSDGRIIEDQFDSFEQAMNILRMVRDALSLQSKFTATHNLKKVRR